MAYGVTPYLREPHVCETACSHRDCAAKRALVAGLCQYCGESIGEGVEFTYAGEPDTQTAVHMACAWDAEDNDDDQP